MRRGSSTKSGKEYTVGYGKPPVEGQFPMGQSGCPGGRGGKQRVPEPLSDYDQLLLGTLDHEVPTSDGKKVSLIKRNLQQAAVEAAKGDQKVSARLRAEYARSSSKKAAALDSEIAEWLEPWMENNAAFDDAECKGIPPPDLLPHPDHVQITDQGVAFNGPLSKEDRAAWEYVKYRMRFLSDAVIITRKAIEAHPEIDSLKTGLRTARALREQVRRLIPKGWNWKERIYTLGGSKEEIKAFETRLDLLTG